MRTDDYWGRPVHEQGLTNPLDCAEFRVRFWLEHYQELETAVYLGCGVDAAEETGGGSRSAYEREASWASLVHTKADIDKQIGYLGSPLSDAVMLWARDQHATRAIGRLLHCSRMTVQRSLKVACRRMARGLLRPHLQETHRKIYVPRRSGR